ncbi:radical SAM protein [Candidatus Parcubacteria bacterium]|nr:radical SAM protein [Candidatus Parcubacteria bacterium]
MKRFSNHAEPWGKFIDIKKNAAQTLDKELKKVRPKSVLLSSVTDAYNPIEKKYGLTRQILKVLLKYQIPTSILTKSDLVLRDIDLLSRFDDCQVGFSFLSLNSRDSRNFEPTTTIPKRRINALKELKNNDIRTYAFIGPIMPYITELDPLFMHLSDVSVDYIFCESFNNRGQARSNIRSIIKQKYSHIQQAFWDSFDKNSDYWPETAQYINKLSDFYKIPVNIFFHR